MENYKLDPNGGSQFTIKVTIERLQNARKKNISLKNKNKELNNELISLQSNIRDMFPGYSVNKATPFPMMNDLLLQINVFIKNDCLEFYKTLLDQDYSLHDQLFSFRKLFASSFSLINDYFNPLNLILKHTLQTDQIISPLDCVLRRSYQVDWEKLLNQIKKNNDYDYVINSILNELEIENQTQETYTQMINIFEETTEMLFKGYISDPSLAFDINQISKQVLMDSNKYDCFDYKMHVKHNTSCVVIIPPVYKIINDHQVILINAKVLPIN